MVERIVEKIREVPVDKIVEVPPRPTPPRPARPGPARPGPPPLRAASRNTGMRGHADQPPPRAGGGVPPRCWPAPPRRKSSPGRSAPRRGHARKLLQKAA